MFNFINIDLSKYDSAIQLPGYMRIPPNSKCEYVDTCKYLYCCSRGQDQNSPLEYSCGLRKLRICADFRELKGDE